MLPAILITGGFRLYTGGSGAVAGIAVIVTSGLTGLAWRRSRTLDPATVSLNDIATQYHLNPKDRDQYIQGLLRDGHIRNFECRVRRRDGPVDGCPSRPAHNVRAPFSTNGAGLLPGASSGCGAKNALTPIGQIGYCQEYQIYRKK